MHTDNARDLFENAFRVFVDSLDTLGMDAEEQCEAMGNYNVPWELQHDVAETAVVLAEAAISYFDDLQKAHLIALARALEALPREAVSPSGTLTNNRSGSLQAMRHPAWAPLRRQARELLRQLKPAIERNARYFDSPGEAAF
ncbi:hypothetical protein KPL74_04935 [Bacillus sp. NP157]|nr:hypothetical protein KPL74_04935 [Bacillus sp. NP157]